MPSPNNAKPDPIQSLRPTSGDGAIHSYTLLNPLEAGWQTVRISHLYFGTKRYSDLSSIVTIPIQEPEYNTLCTNVLTVENALITLLSTHRAALSDEKRSKFDDLLIRFELPRNILMRAQVIEAEQKFIGAGMYLGSLTTDKTLGCELYSLVSEAYTSAIGQPPPDDVKDVCTTWGLLQGKARSLITEATWRSLMNRPDTPIPKEFARNLATLLEHDLLDMFRKKESEYPWGLRTREEFDNWLADATLLYKQRQAQPCDSLPSQDGHSAHPHLVFRLNGKVKSIHISPLQALRHWSQYLSVSSLESVRIEIPVDRYPGYSESQLSGHLEQEMKDLGKSPLAPFINSFWADVSYANCETIKLIFNNWGHFLGSLVHQNHWRPAQKPQVVKIMFAHAMPNSAQTIDAMLKQPRSFHGVQVYPNQFSEEGAQTITALVAPGIPKL